MNLSFSFVSPSPDILARFAQAIYASLDSQQIAQIALTYFQEIFPPARLVLYQADSSKRVLRLLAACPEVGTWPSGHVPLVLPYDVSSLVASAFQERSPILVTDLHHPTLATDVPLESHFSDEDTRSCICLPFWCGRFFEGCLLATFPTVFPLTDVDAQLLGSCALHLATALSTARLHGAVEEERTRQRAILEQLPEGILITEAASGTISYANEVAAQILGVPLQGLIDSTLHVSTQANAPLSDDIWPRVPWTFAVIRALGGETVNQMEAVVIHATGAHIPILCSGTPLRGRHGQITGAILVFQDIAEPKNLEAQKQLFFSFASHELRTPLTVILGYAELLYQITAAGHAGQLDVPLVHLASQNIGTQVEQMAYLIDELLDLSRLDRKQVVLRLAPVNLVDIVRRVIENLAITAPRHQLRLIFDGGDCEEADLQIMVLADTKHLPRILNNLVQNAIKYSPGGGDIEVGIQRHPSSSAQILFWVRDHGLGIAQSDLPHLFTRFYRAPSLDRAISGLGIGLYLVKQMIELQGGLVWAESIEGQGSTFFLSLPLAATSNGGVVGEKKRSTEQL